MLKMLQSTLTHTWTPQPKGQVGEIVSGLCFTPQQTCVGCKADSILAINEDAKENMLEQTVAQIWETYMCWHINSFVHLAVVCMKCLLVVMEQDHKIWGCKRQIDLEQNTYGTLCIKQTVNLSVRRQQKRWFPRMAKAKPDPETFTHRKDAVSPTVFKWFSLRKTRVKLELAGRSTCLLSTLLDWLTPKMAVTEKFVHVGIRSGYQWWIIYWKKSSVAGQIVAAQRCKTLGMIRDRRLLTSYKGRSLTCLLNVWKKWI